MDVRISGKTSLLGVIGSPIGHSGSPVMYNFCFDYYGLDAVYLAFDCKEEETEDTIAAIRRLHMKGANVTMPCKQKCAEYMDELRGAAKYIGAVNTIVNEDGRLIGYSTDGKGVILDLLDHGVSIQGKRICLLGAGGAATAIMVQCVLDGAAAVTVFNRSEKGLKKAGEIGKRLQEEKPECQMQFHFLSEETYLQDVIRSADILINATSIGMRPLTEGQSLVTDLSVFHPDLVVYDVIYNPPVTKLMQDALEHGCRPEKVIGGKGMLMWQGSCAFELYTGRKMPTDALKAFLAKREKEGTPKQIPI